MLEIRFIIYGSAEYQQTLQLRNEVLRKPLGLSLNPAETAGEENHLHIAAFDGKRMLGCLVLTPKADKTVQMRQVAVLQTERQKGIGKSMAVFAENFLKTGDTELIILCARKNVAGFYQKLGFSEDGDEYERMGITHINMIKKIQP